MNRAAKIINLPFARNLGLTGKGIGVAIMDTGIAYHPDLCGNNGALRGFYDTVNHAGYYYDDNGHGTHIAGILAGNGRHCNGIYQGVAPECHIYMIKILKHYIIIKMFLIQLQLI